MASHTVLGFELRCLAQSKKRSVSIAVVFCSLMSEELTEVDLTVHCLVSQEMIGLQQPFFLQIFKFYKKKNKLKRQVTL